MMWLGEEAKALLKQLEKLFENLVVRITDFQNDWDRCDPIWRLCWHLQGDLPGPGIEPRSLALHGRRLTV